MRLTPLKCSTPRRLKAVVRRPVLEIRPEGSHFQRMLEETLLDGHTYFFSAGQEEFGHCLRRSLKNRRRLLDFEKVTEPSMKRSSSLPPVLNFVVLGHVLPNAFEKIALD